MTMKQFAVFALIVVTAILTLYFGMRFIDAVFTSVEKQVVAVPSQL